MDLNEINARIDRELAEERKQEAERRIARKQFLADLFGSPDRRDWQSPTAIEDFDAVLAQHAAQLRNAVRHMMGDVLEDDGSPERRTHAAAALTRMIQTNIAIAKVLGEGKTHAPSKTVHGGPAHKDPQD